MEVRNRSDSSSSSESSCKCSLISDEVRSSPDRDTDNDRKPSSVSSIEYPSEEISMSSNLHSQVTGGEEIPPLNLNEINNQINLPDANLEMNDSVEDVPLAIVSSTPTIGTSYPDVSTQNEPYLEDTKISYTGADTDRTRSGSSSSDSNADCKHTGKDDTSEPTFLSEKKQTVLGERPKRVSDSSSSSESTAAPPHSNEATSYNVQHPRLPSQSEYTLTGGRPSQTLPGESPGCHINDSEIGNTSITSHTKAQPDSISASSSQPSISPKTSTPVSTPREDNTLQGRHSMSSTSSTEIPSLQDIAQEENLKVMSAPVHYELRIRKESSSTSSYTTPSSTPRKDDVGESSHSDDRSSIEPGLETEEVHSFLHDANIQNRGKICYLNDKKLCHIARL